MNIIAPAWRNNNGQKPHPGHPSAVHPDNRAKSSQNSILKPNTIAQWFFLYCIKAWKNIYYFYATNNHINTLKYPHTNTNKCRNIKMYKLVEKNVLCLSIKKYLFISIHPSIYNTLYLCCCDMSCRVVNSSTSSFPFLLQLQMPCQ